MASDYKKLGCKFYLQFGFLNEVREAKNKREAARTETYMVHHLLKPLAEGALTNPEGALQLWERKMPNAGHHSILLHHRIGYLGHLPQVIFCS